MNSDYIKIFSLLLAVLLGGVVSITLSGIVIHDWQITHQYSAQTCSGGPIEHLDVISGDVCSWGYAQVSLLSGSNNNTKVMLYYPPAPNSKYIICKAATDVKSWSASIGSASQLNCFVQDPNALETVGIISYIESFAGWCVLMVVGCVLALVSLVMGILILYDAVKDACCN